MADLTDVQRRVLGNLPVYRTADGHAAAAGMALKAGTIASADAWLATRTIEDVAARLVADAHTPLDDESEVVEVLEDLRAAGYASLRGAQWAMTRSGLDALVN